MEKKCYFISKRFLFLSTMQHGWQSIKRKKSITMISLLATKTTYSHSSHIPKMDKMEKYTWDTFTFEGWRQKIDLTWKPTAVVFSEILDWHSVPWWILESLCIRCCLCRIICNNEWTVWEYRHFLSIIKVFRIPSISLTCKYVCQNPLPFQPKRERIHDTWPQKF